MRVYNGAESLAVNARRPHWREDDLSAALRSSLAVNDVPDPPISAVREEGLCAASGQDFGGNCAVWV